MPVTKKQRNHRHPLQAECFSVTMIGFCFWQHLLKEIIHWPLFGLGGKTIWKNLEKGDEKGEKKRINQSRIKHKMNV